MSWLFSKVNQGLNFIFDKLGLDLKDKLIFIFLLVKVIPLILLAAIAWRQFTIQGDELKKISVNDSSQALNDIAVENIERMSTDAAKIVADFLYARDDDIRYLANEEPSEDLYQGFIERQKGKLLKKGEWVLAADGRSWERTETISRAFDKPQSSSNQENNDKNGFRYRPPDPFEYEFVALYDEITFVDLEGNEIIKVFPKDSAKKNYPLSGDKKNISQPENTYIKAENYFEELKTLKAGEIAVSDVIGAYVGSNYIGMYAPEVVSEAAESRGYEIEYAPQKQAYAGEENPNGQRFEGIVRWASPVVGSDGKIKGYITMALNHDHVMEFVDHLTPMHERYTQLPSAYEGNYAFIWDYRGRSICHPRHHSIVGYDPQTGEAQIPWLEQSVYQGWKDSGLEKWHEFTKTYPEFYQQSREKKATPELTKQALVGLDCRWLNNAPQCTGWMDLTAKGGSGSFYILWSNLYKLNTAAAIPYYTGRYGPSEANDWSKRGFGFVAIGSGLEFFTNPAKETEERLSLAVRENLSGTFWQLSTTTIILVVLVVLIAISMASFLTKNITILLNGISRFRQGERQYRFNTKRKDEFGHLADSFDEMADGIVASVKNPLCIIDMDEKIIYANDKALDLMGKSFDEVIGMPYSTFSLYPADSPSYPITALKKGQEPEIYHEIEKNIYVKPQASSFFSKDGEQVGYFIETVDLSEVVKKQIELEKAMNAANLANMHKGSFLARMSHEIRTPMNAIVGLTNIMQRDLIIENVNVEQFKERVEHIATSSQHLMALLNDILDISKIEAGKIYISKEKTNLLELIKTVVNIIQPRCEEKNVFFENYLDPFDPNIFLLDPLRLRQVLINLLGNAVKFTPEGGTVELYVLNLKRKDGRTLVEFRVKDNGVGIPGDYLKEIFKPFEQIGDQIRDISDGTGLGLPISRHIVQLLGGDIEVASKDGEGSTFTFKIWFDESTLISEEVKVTDEMDKFLAGKRVLLVDDVELNRKVAKAMLKIQGMIVDEADDGISALEEFKKSSLNYYDLILMDLLMPNMDGYEACRAIRALDRQDAADIPIIALTANAFQDDIDKAILAGMNAHISKPVKIEKLIAAIVPFFV